MRRFQRASTHATSQYSHRGWTKVFIGWTLNCDHSIANGVVICCGKVACSGSIGDDRVTAVTTFRVIDIVSAVMRAWCLRALIEYIMVPGSCGSLNISHGYRLFWHAIKSVAKGAEIRS